MAGWLTPAAVRVRTSVPAGVTDEQLDRAQLAASQVLSGLTGLRAQRQVLVVGESCGCGTLLTGPHGRTDVGAAGTAGSSPFYWRAGSDLVLSQGSGGCWHDLVLPDNPVLSVTGVSVGGVALAGGWDVVDGNRVRLPAGQVWASPVEVTYLVGGLTELALRAAATLAGELVKAETGDRSCQLPQRVQTVSRQGVTFTLLDPQTFLDGGRTGLYLVDLFLASTRAPRRSVGIASPDLPTLRPRSSTPVGEAAPVVDNGDGTFLIVVP